jgi:antirestriction protein
MQIWIGNLAKYNEERFVGKWVELPCHNLEEVISEILGQDEEYFIADHEDCPFPVSEHDSPYRLNEYAEKCDSLTDHDLARLKFLMDNHSYSSEEAIEKYDDVSFYPNMTLRQLAEEFIEEGIFGEIPESITSYIDYDAIARDLANDYFENDHGCFRLD